MAKDDAADVPSRRLDSPSAQTLDVFTHKVGHITRRFHNPTPRHSACHPTYEDRIDYGRTSFVDMERPAHLGWAWERCRARQTSVKNSYGYRVICFQGVVVIRKHKGGIWLESLSHAA